MATIQWTQNFTKDQMVGLGVAFIIVPTVFVSLRFWAKSLAHRGTTKDDYLLVLALLFAIACNITQLVAAEQGELGSHEVNGPNGLPEPDDQRFIIFERTKFAINIIYPVGLGLVKSSILLFYIGIFPSRAFQITSKIMMAIVVAWSVAFFFANLFICNPVTPLIEPFYDHGNSKCYNGVPMWYTGCVTDIAIDLILLAMPLRPVLKLHLPIKQKMGVLVMFLLGAL